MFRFTIRDVFWLTARVGLIVALFVQGYELARQRAESDRWQFRAKVLSKELKDSGYSVSWDEGTAQQFVHDDGIEGTFIGEIVSPSDLIAILRRTEPRITHMAFNPSRRTGLVQKESIPRAIAVLERAIEEARRT